MTTAERLTRLEAEFAQIKNSQEDFKMMQSEINRKLDDLIALRNRGAGAFWLASVLFGTTLVGLVGTVIAWLKG